MEKPLEGTQGKRREGMRARQLLLKRYLTDDEESGGGRESAAGHVLGHAGEVGPVPLAGLDQDQVAVRGLDVVGVPLRLHLHPVLQPVDLEYIFNI